jgi:plastocyanin
VRRAPLISAVALAAALTLPAAAGAVARQINVNDDFFAPKNPPTRNFSNGPSFRWESVAGATNDHNVRQNDKLFFSGVPRDPLNFRVRASAGSYRYYCTLHRATGMTGRIKVRPLAIQPSQGGRIDIRWANSNTNTGSRFDVRYRVDQRRWKTWKNDTRAFHAFFGRNNNPVDYRPSRHNYKVKVRSERRKVSKRSDWSPARRF